MTSKVVGPLVFRKHFGLILGPILFVAVLSLLPTNSLASEASRIAGNSATPADLARLVFSMKVVLALLVLMVTWWLTEAVPLPVTALLPAAILPWFHVAILSDGKPAVLSFRLMLANYANPVIFLFFGGFLIAAAMRRWGVDKRLTYWFLSRGRIATDPRFTLLGMMVLSAFMSLWISNTVTTAMLLPIGIGIASQAGARPGESKFGTALMLGIAWSASIGGVGTIIGTPPNGVVLGILQSMLSTTEGFRRITFLDWMKFGIPHVAIFLPIAWFTLLKLFPPEMRNLAEGREQLLQKRVSLGRMTSGEKWTISAFFLAVLLWTTNPFWDELLPQFLAVRFSGVDEFTIGLCVGLLLFLLPTNLSRREFVLTWDDAKSVDWGTLLLFGGGIALSDAMFKTGAASWLASSTVGMIGAPPTAVLVAVTVLLVGLFSEVASNTAVTTMMAPIMISLAQGTGTDPATLAIAAALASSLGFMLPVATPPNALVYGTGHIRLHDMLKTGLVFDILGWLITVGVLWFFGSQLFGIVRF
jgi:sodium-dependent dicarboxylate transporter 2/3/5